MMNDLSKSNGVNYGSGGFHSCESIINKSRVDSGESGSNDWVNGWESGSDDWVESCESGVDMRVYSWESGVDSWESWSDDGKMRVDSWEEWSSNSCDGGSGGGERSDSSNGISNAAGS